jgi:hypothetical protein
MRLHAFVRCVVWLAALGCTAESGADDAGQPPAIDECASLPAVTLSATPSILRVRGATTLHATGGSGRYTYALATGGSGGALNADRFVAGATPGADTITASDDCGNSVDVKLSVAAAFSVAPTRASVKPGAGFRIRVDGLLGDARFMAESLASGGSVSDAGEYRAGSAEGMDLIAVRDSGSGEEVVVQVHVYAGAQLRGSPARLALPSGASIALHTQDGSGELDWTIVSGPGSLNGAVFSTAAADSGSTVLEASDQFTQERTRIGVQILEELTHPSKPHGRLTDAANLVTGDFDGDGVTDVALGVPESDLGRPTGGAVFIFKGTASGLPDKPTWTLTGESDTANLGAVLAAGDLDGDGHADLAISAPGADVTVADSGAVLLYRFDKDGPQLIRPALTGLGRGNFGASLAIADVDGDGDADLIVGSPGADLAASSTLKERGVVDVFVLDKRASIPDLGTLRIGGADLAPDGSLKEAPSLRFGRAVAVADFNGDGRADLASLGAVNNALLAGTALAKNQSAVAVHFGRASSPMFEADPDLYVLPANTADSSEGSWKLSLAPAADGGATRLLLSADQLDSPDLAADGGNKSGANSGGAYLFDLSDQSAVAKPVQLGRNDAFARVWGDSAGMAAGRSATVADVDGDGTLELVLGAPNASVTQKVDGKDTSLNLAGKLLVFPYATLLRGAQLNKPSDLRAAALPVDTLGVAVAAFAPGDAKGLLAYAARASTQLGDFTGRLDAYLGSGPLASFAKTSVEIPARVASQQLGAALQVGVSGGRVRALVGVPGYSGAGSKADGNELSAGQAWLHALGDGAQGQLVAEGAATRYASNGRDAFGGRSVGSSVGMSDFDGDGLADLVIAAPQLSTPQANNTEYAQLRPACVTSSSQSNGGAFVQLAQRDGSFKEGFRVLAPTDIAGCTPADASNTSTCKRTNLGRAGLVGGFDFDGDGKQDLLLTRNNGIDVFLGRAPDDAQLAKPSLACDPAFTLPALAQNVSAPAALGDLDGDGCDEVAVRYANDTRSGLLIAFGFSANGGRCAGHTQAAWLRVSGDAESGMNNMQLGVASARAGKVLGDARVFVAISAALFPFEGVPQPTVLLYDEAQLKAKRPDHGEAVVAALGAGLSPIALVYRERAAGFGRALAGDVDLDGDGTADLVVSAPGASINGDGTGAVFAFRGGATLNGKLDAWLCVVGDGSERASVGQALSLVGRTASTPAVLAIGAPLSYRTGTANGTAWLLAIDE